MSVARAAKKAVESVYGTVYTVGSASDILCEFDTIITPLTHAQETCKRNMCEKFLAFSFGARS